MSAIEAPARDLPLATVVALDLVAAHLNPTDGAALALGSDSVALQATGAWLDGPHDHADPGIEPVRGTYRRVLWLFPDDAARVRRVLPAILAPGGRVGIVSAGRLAPVLDRARAARPARRAFPLARTLRQVGLRIDLSCGIGGPRSAVLALLVRAAEAADRLDLADRLELAYRRSLAPRDGAAWADTIAIVAVRA